MANTLFANLLNGSSKVMSVNGSVTPQVFSYSPGGGQTVAIRSIACVLKDDGTTSLDKFGAITALTNGLICQTTQSGVTQTLFTIKDNSDLCTRFYANQFGNGSILSVLGLGTPQGFGASNNIFVGYMELIDPILLFDTDLIMVAVQDNLSAIDILNMAVKFSE